MKLRVIYLSLFAISFFSIEIYTQDIQQLDLKIFIDDVIKRNPDLAAIKSRVKAAAIAVQRVQVIDDPVFISRFINNPFGSKDTFVRQRRYRIKQTFPFIGKLRLRGEIAQHILEFMESDEETTLRTLVLQAKKLYFQLFFNKVSLDINKENRDIVSRFIQSASALYKTGKGTQDDILKAQIELQMLDDELLELMSEKEMLIAMINALMNRPQTYAFGELKEIITTDIVFDFDQLVSIAMRERSELHGLQAKVDEEYAIAALARRDYYPDITVIGMIQHTDEQNAWGLDISFDIPLWVSRRQGREIEEAEARAVANMSSLVNLRNTIQARIRELLAKIDTSQERIKLYKTGLIPKITETLSVNESHYMVGKEDFLTLLDTRRQLHNFQLDYERARVEREIFLAELEWEVNKPLEKISFDKPIVTFEQNAQAQKRVFKTGLKRKKIKQKKLTQKQKKKTKRLKQKKRRPYQRRKRKK